MPRRGKRQTEKPSRGQRNCDWIEKHCYIPQGKYAGQKVKLRDWQKQFICAIYDNPEGTRRAILSVGRKNAKTTLAAFLLLLHLVGDEYKPSSRLYSAAQSREQAGIIFDLAATCVRRSPTLLPHVQIQQTRKCLICPALDTRYEALSAEVKTTYGLSPVFIIHDELGQVSGPRSELYEALETATGAHENPLSIIISTQAPTENDLLSILIDDAKGGYDPHTVLKLYSADLDADPFAEATIRQANPAFGDFQNAKEILQYATNAKRIPTAEAGYRNLYLNQRVEASNPFVTTDIWRSCATPPTPLTAVPPVFGGLDLSAVNDLTALVLISQTNDRWQVFPTFWLPGEGLAERSRLDRVPYDKWAERGDLNAIAKRKSIEPEFVATEIAKLFSKYNIKKIGFDRWGFNNLKPWLVKAGIPETVIDEKFVPFGQGYQSMSPALKTLKGLLLNEKLCHGSHPVLNMCALNAVVTMDASENIKLDKKRSRSRIDGMVALAMAVGVAESTPAQEKKKEFQMLFV